MISDLNLLLNHYDSIVCDLICKLCTHIIVWIQRPQSDNNWENRRGWLWCEDHMCSWSVDPLLQCSNKRSTLIASSSLEAPLLELDLELEDPGMLFLLGHAQFITGFSLPQSCP